MKNYALSIFLVFFSPFYVTAMELDTQPINDARPVKLRILQENEVPLHILKKCGTLFLLVEDCGQNELALPEHRQSRYLGILFSLLARNEAHEKDELLSKIFTLLDAHLCAALLNSADFYEIPSLFTLLTQQLAQKIMTIHKEELLANSQGLTINPALEPFVANYILEKNPDVRLAILKSYPLEEITVFYDLDPESFLYSLHNETLVCCNNPDKYIEIRQLPSAELVHTIPVPAFHDVTAITHSPDGKTVAIGLKNPYEEKSRIVLYDSFTGALYATFYTQNYYVNALLFSPNNKKITALFSSNTMVTTWDISTSEIIECTAYRATGILRYSPENILVELIIDFPYIEIRNLKNRLLIKNFWLGVGMCGIKKCTIHKSVIKIGKNDHTTELWNFAGQLIKTYNSRGNAHLLHYNTYSPTFIDDVSENAIKLFDAHTDEHIHTIPVSSITHSGFSPDGNTIISFFKNQLSLWNIKKINNISQHITVPQLALLCALSKNVIGLNDIKYNLCLKTIADSLDFNSTKFYAHTSFKNRVKSVLH